MNRREFVKLSMLSAAAGLAGCSTPGLARTKEDVIWAGLFHMDTNMWSDLPVSSWGPYKGEELKLVCQADHVRFDEKVWRSLTDRMVKVGMNMVIIDLG